MVCPNRGQHGFKFHLCIKTLFHCGPTEFCNNHWISKEWEKLVKKRWSLTTPEGSLTVTGFCFLGFCNKIQIQNMKQRVVKYQELYEG